MFDKTKEVYDVFGSEIRDMEVLRNESNDTLTIMFRNDCPIDDITFSSTGKSIDHIVSLLSDNPDTCYRIEIRKGELFHVKKLTLF